MSLKAKFIVCLTAEQRQELEKLSATGKRSAATILRTRILLKADADAVGWADDQIAEALDTSPATIARVRKRFVQQALSRLPSSVNGPPVGSTANWTASRRLTWLPWPVARRRRAEPAGR